MLGLRCAAFCAILLHPLCLSASSVFRCEDADGHVTFTLHGCRTDQAQQLQDTHNPRPGGDRQTVPMAKSARPFHPTSPRRAQPLTVVGEQQDGCGNRLIGSARREAMLKRQARAGMTRNDVESTFGRPDRISSRNGRTHYHYADDRGNRRQISFDEAGCVDGNR